MNLTRSRFIAMLISCVFAFLKWRYPEFPEQSFYGPIVYIGGESLADAVGRLRGWKPDTTNTTAPQPQQ